MAQKLCKMIAFFLINLVLTTFAISTVGDNPETTLQPINNSFKTTNATTLLTDEIATNNNGESLTSIEPLADTETSINNSKTILSTTKTTSLPEKSTNSVLYRSDMTSIISEPETFTTETYGGDMTSYISEPYTSTTKTSSMSGQSDSLLRTDDFSDILSSDGEVVDSLTSTVSGSLKETFTTPEISQDDLASTANNEDILSSTTSIKSNSVTNSASTLATSSIADDIPEKLDDSLTSTSSYEDNLSTASSSSSSNSTPINMTSDSTSSKDSNNKSTSGKTEMLPNPTSITSDNLFTFSTIEQLSTSTNTDGLSTVTTTESIVASSTNTFISNDSTDTLYSSIITDDVSTSNPIENNSPSSNTTTNYISTSGARETVSSSSTTDSTTQAPPSPIDEPETIVGFDCDFLSGSLCSFSQGSEDTTDFVYRDIDGVTSLAALGAATTKGDTVSLISNQLDHTGPMCLTVVYTTSLRVGFMITIPSVVDPVLEQVISNTLSRTILTIPAQSTDKVTLMYERKNTRAGEIVLHKVALVTGEC